MVECEFSQKEQELYSRPMPMIGLYVAAASLVCTLAMAADSFHGFRHRRFWFPCKYFTLNAASLTMIAIAMKLPVDLNNSMPSYMDQLSKLSGTCFMCTMLANFLPSLGPMSNTEIVSSILAVGILVITIVVNICIEVSTTLISDWTSDIVILAVTFMLSLYVIMVSSALTVPDSKKILEIKYHEIREEALDEEFERTGKSVVEKLRQRVSQYWIMAETGSPQFVIACSPTCSACGAMCLVLTYIYISILMAGICELIPPEERQDKSDYTWSIIPICIIQSIGGLVGSIAPIFRWFSALTFKLSLKWSKNYLKVYTVEKYWIQRLVDWKHNRVPINIGGYKYKRLVVDLRNLVLNFFIAIQVIVVVVCKAVRLIPIFLVIMVVYFWHCCKSIKHILLKARRCSLNDLEGMESNQQHVATKTDLSLYVLQLQDEVELANRTLKSISKVVNRTIRKSEKQQAKNLMRLLEKSTGFKGLAEFDNDQVPHLQNDQELQASNSWSLVVITLTSILIAIPNIRSGILDLTLRGVSEGLSYVRLVEESLYAGKSDMENIIKAAKNVWLEVELYNKWLDNNLQERAHKEKTSKEILEWFCEKATNTVTELDNRKNRGSGLKDISLHKIIAANSMYRISHTLLLDFQSSDYDTNEMLFEKLSVMIADILGACLINLPRVITMKCCADAIERREESVTAAARILGQTKDIMEVMLYRFEIPNLNPDELADIESWCAAMKHQNPTSLVSSGNNESISSSSDELVIVNVQLEE